jgi:hypothetical protein
MEHSDAAQRWSLIRRASDILSKWISRAPATMAMLALAGYALLLLVLQVLPHYDALLLAPVIAIVVVAVGHLKHSLRAVGLIAAAWALIATFLADQWQTGVGGRHALVGGIIPWADASDFLAEALRKVHGLPFTAHASKRPLFPLLLAFVLRCTHLHLRGAISVFAFAGATMLGAATELIWRKTGRAGAFCAFLLLILYARRYLAVVGTESLGFILGASAFLSLAPTLWRARAETSDALGANASSARATAVGSFFLALGLAARAGPMLALPALWITVSVRAQRGQRLRAAIPCVAASCVAFVLNQCILLTSGTGRAFSDYPAIFYGMLHGEDFTYFAAQHPAGTDIREVIVAELQAQPTLLVWGMTRSVGAFLFGPHGLFSIGWYNPDDRLLEAKGAVFAVLRSFVATAGWYRSLNVVAMAACSCMFVIVVLCWATQVLRTSGARASANLLFAILSGVVLSSAFTPPWITEGSQLQATTICFLVAIPGALIHRNPPHPNPITEPPRNVRAPAIGFAVCTTLVALAWLTMRLVPYPMPSAHQCHPEVPHVRILPGSAVAFTDDESRGYNPARFHDNMAAMRKNFSDFVLPVEAVVTPRHTFQYVFDSCSRSGKILILETDEANRLGTGEWVFGLATPIDVLHRVLLAEPLNAWQRDEVP